MSKIILKVGKRKTTIPRHVIDRAVEKAYRNAASDVTENHHEHRIENNKSQTKKEKAKRA